MFDQAAEGAYNTPATNSTLFLPLLMSLSQYKIAPDDAPYFYSSYDYIVVGGGAGGSAVASRLSEINCASVLLLEAGIDPPLVSDVPGYSKFFRNTVIDWKYYTQPQKYTAQAYKDRKIELSMGKALGGSTVINDQEYVRGNRFDYDNWASHGAKGWDFDSVYKYFLKMENNLNEAFIDDGYHAVDGPLGVEQSTYDSEIKAPLLKAFADLGHLERDINAANQTGVYNIQATNLNSQRCSGAKAYLVPAGTRPNIDILTNATAKRINIQNGEAVGVTFEYRGKDYYVSAAQEIIVSAGSIATPQLLMLSGIGPKEHLQKFNIDVVQDLPVGKNFQNHPTGVLHYALDTSIQNYQQKLGDYANVKNYIDNRKGPMASPSVMALLGFIHVDENSTNYNLPDIQIFFYEFDVKLLKGELNADVYERVFAPYESVPLYQCFAQVLRPKSTGAITLQSTDIHDHPLIDTNYLQDPYDVEIMLRGMKLCHNVSTSDYMRQAVNAQPLNNTYEACKNYERFTEESFRCITKQFIQTLHHPVGTARMGDPNDRTTVVDPQLRVVGVQGLRVADASVMPFITSGNTMIPTYLIGEKAADMIKDTFYANYYCQPDSPYQGPVGHLPKNETSEDVN